MNTSKHKDFFTKEMKRMNFAENTIRNYLSNLEKFFEYFKDKEHPLHINQDEIRDYLYQFKTPNTQRSHHGAIKKYYRICLKQKDKFKYIPYARKEKKLPQVLSKDEVQRMFSVCENLKHKVILSLLYGCGLRVSELINLKWENINRERKVIHVISGKGKKDRNVMLPKELIELLLKYWYKYESTTYVLNGQKSLKYSKTSVSKVIKSLAQKAGIKKCVWTHQMRHNCFTHMVESGTDINLIQKLAGHNSVKTTMMYVQISDSLISNIQSPLQNIKIH